MKLEVCTFSEANQLIKHPEKVAIAIIPTPEGGFNLITLEWVMRCSLEPPMFAISIGHTRYSYECLQQADSFNLCYPSIGMRDEVMLCGTKSGRDVDKLAEGKFDWIPGRFKKIPLLTDAVANFECMLSRQIRSGDHTIFIGEVRYAWQGTHKQLLVL